MSFATISPRDLHQKKSQGEDIELIDVRTPLEFGEVHAIIARNVPLDRLKPDEIASGRTGAADEPTYVICKSGSRGAKAAQVLVDAGHRNVVNVEGGTEAWAAAGLPVRRGKKVMSLERQVRLVAGFIVCVGALLGIFVHPSLAGIAALVGAGLMFAAITDTCAMGMLIAKMPWNQVTCDVASSTCETN